MTMYVACAVDNNGITTGLLWRGKLVVKLENATPYNSPSAARAAIKRVEHLAAAWDVRPLQRPTLPAPKKPTGGTREGAGRPALGVRPVTLRLSEKDIEHAKKLGDGNVTAGIRRALAAALKTP